MSWSEADARDDDHPEDDPWLEEIWPEDAWGADREIEPVAHRRLIPLRWRLAGVLAALSMLAIPLWNVISAPERQTADNGLAICGLDYCEVEEAIVAAGHLDTMARASAQIVPDAQVQDQVDRLIAVVGGPPVTAEVVDELPGSLGGRYIETTRTIQIDRPATMWLIAHEVAHTVGPGHGDRFVDALVELADHLAAPGT